MRKLLLILILMVLTLLELIWPRFLSFFNARPDLLLVYMLAAVFFLDFKFALFLGILSGLIKDVFLPFNFGWNIILFAFWSYLIYKLLRQITAENLYLRVGLVLLVALFNNLIIGLQSLNSGNLIPWGIFLRNLIVTSVYTAGFAPWIFKLFAKISA